VDIARADLVGSMPITLHIIAVRGRTRTFLRVTGHRTVVPITAMANTVPAITVGSKVALMVRASIMWSKFRGIMDRTRRMTGLTVRDNRLTSPASDEATIALTANTATRRLTETGTTASVKMQKASVTGKLQKPRRPMIVIAIRNANGRKRRTNASSAGRSEIAALL
jgi:hypothetical protein